MRHSRLLCLLVLSLILSVSCVSAQENVTIAIVGTSGFGDPYYPMLGNGGYNAEHYSIDLDVDMVNHSLTATVTMQATAIDSLTRFNLDFSNFTIHTLTVNNVAASFERDQGELIITPPEQINQGDNFTLTVQYSGSPAPNAETTDHAFSHGWVWVDSGAYVASQPNGSSRWFPVNDHPRDKARYTIEVTVPQPYTAVANGILQEVINEADGRRTFIWNSDDLMASYLVTVNIAEFLRDDATSVQGIPIRNYFPSGRVAEGSYVLKPR